MSHSRFVGIDPGLAGGLAILERDEIVWLGDLPVHQVGVTGKRATRPELDLHALHGVLGEHGPYSHCFIEKVGPMPKQGVASTFRFGFSFGAVQRIVAALAAPLTLALPQTWQRWAGCRPGPAASGTAAPGSGAAVGQEEGCEQGGCSVDRPIQNGRTREWQQRYQRKRTAMTQAKPTPVPIPSTHWPAIYRNQMDSTGPLNDPHPAHRARAVTEAQWRNLYHSDRSQGGCNSDPAQLAQMILCNFNNYSRLGTPRVIDCTNLAAALVAELHEGHNSPARAGLDEVRAGAASTEVAKRAEIILLYLSGYPRPYRLKWKARSTTWARQQEAERDTDRANLAAALTAMRQEGQAAAQAETALPI